MSSLTELNSYSNNTVTFTDSRSHGVKFAWLTSKNLSFTVETNTFTVQRSNEIEEIIQPTQALVEYEVDVSAVSGSTVSWSTTPAGCNVVSSNGVFIMKGIDSVSDWQTVRAPTITIPNTFQGSFFYNVKIRYNTPEGVLTQGWQVGTFVSVSSLSSSASLTATATATRGTDSNLSSYISIAADLTNAGFSGPSTFNFTKSTTETITGTPTIVYEGAGDGWSITITPSDPSVVDTMSSTGFTSFNSTTKALTIGGTTAQVIGHLQNITLTTTSVKQDIFLLYEGTVAEATVNEKTYTVRQQMNCLNLDYLTEPRATSEYLTSTESLIGDDGPQILDPDYTGAGTYALTLTPTITTQVQNLRTTGITKWGIEQEIAYSDQYQDDAEEHISQVIFGSSMDVMVISATGNDKNATQAGSVKWYVKDSSGVYQPVQTYYGLSYYANTGNSIAMADDDTLIVGQNLWTTDGTPNDGVGRVLIFERGAGNSWSLSQTINAPDGETNSKFGGFVKCSRNGDTLAIAEPTDTDSGETREGRVHIYTRTGTGNYTKKATILDPEGYDLFNGSFAYNQCTLSLDGGCLAVSRGLGYSDTYIYVGNAARTVWTLAESFPGKTVPIAFSSDGSSYVSREFVGTASYLYVKSRAGNTWTTENTYSAPYAPTVRQNNMAHTISGDDNALIYRRTNDDKVVIYDFDPTTYELTNYQLVNIYAESDLTSHRQTIATLTAGFAALSYSSGPFGVAIYSYGPKPAAFNSVTKTLTISGTKTQVNGDIDTIKLTSNSISDIEMTYSVTTPESNTEDKVVKVRNIG